MDEDYFYSPQNLERRRENWEQADEFYEAFRSLPTSHPLTEVHFILKTTQDIDARLSVCDILQAVRPERSKLIEISFNSKSNAVRLDVAIKKDSTVWPLRIVDYDDNEI